MTNVEFINDNTRLTVLLIGEIDHHGAEYIRDTIDFQILKCTPKIVIMDFSKVSFMDSSGIGLVIARDRFCKSCGASLYVGSVNTQTSKILALAGIKTVNSVCKG